MGNSNVKNSSKQYVNRPHSVLGVRSDDCYTDPDVLSRYYHSPSLHPHHSPSNHQDRLPSSNKLSGKAILPPLPRSHSFHQILRPTENGVNLIQKGTIRGIDHRNHQYHHNSGKDLHLKKASDSLAPELYAILRARRCKSEADLLDDNQEDSDTATHEDKSLSEKSTERSIEGFKKGLTNGVAARIQRAKYKAPAPPVPVSWITNDAPNGKINIPKCNQNIIPNEYNNARQNKECKVSSPSSMLMYSESDSRDSKRSLQAKEKSTPSNNKSKLGLIRRLSDKSYFPVQFSSPSLSPNNDNYKNNHDIEFMKFNRLNSDYGDINNPIYSDGNEPSINEINDLIARELALRSSVNDCPNGDNDKELGGNDNNGRRGVSKIFRRDKSNGTGKNNSFNVGSNHCDQSSKTGGKSMYLPPVFDDNFILRRTTPNAGLNGPNGVNNKKLFDLYPSKVNSHDLEKNRYNQEGQMSPKLGLANLFSSDKHQHHQSNHLEGSDHHPFNHNSSCSPSPPDYHNRASHNLRHQQSPANHWSQSILGNNYSREAPISLLPSSSPQSPPALPFFSGNSIHLSSNRKYDAKEESITRLDSLKHLNHASISDSAIYADDEEDSDSATHEDKSLSEKSTERSIEGFKKGLTNGVAARIQRAKYKAPAPPVPVSWIANDAHNGNINISKCNQNTYSKEYNNARQNKECKVSSPSSMLMYSESDSRDSKRSLQAKEKSTPSNNKSKLGLIRRLSDKSYFPVQFSSPSLSPNNDNYKNNHDIEFMKFNRLNSDYGDINNPIYSDGNEPSINEINDLIARELALRSSVNDCPNGDNDKELGGNDNNGRRGVSKIFRRDKSNGTGKNNSFNVGSNHCDQSSKTGGKSMYLPPVFDDNFILRRTTPNAGLNGPNGVNNKKLFDLYPSKVNSHDLEKNRYNQEGQMSPKLGLANLFSSDKHQHHQSNHFEASIRSDHHPLNHNSSSSPSPPDYHNRASHNLSHQQSPANLWSQWILGNNYPREPAPFSLLPPSSPQPPPALPLFSVDSSNRKYESKEESITRLDSLKHLNHSFISDSANYSDEDDEEEIKVVPYLVVKPYLLPPRKQASNEDPLIIADDFFKPVDNSITKCPPLTSSVSRQKHCWTPMEDLTSSDEDEEYEGDFYGIHCDPQSDDDDPMNGKRDVRDLVNYYNTRFTLKNQLRTIIQNNKLRTSQGYP